MKIYLAGHPANEPGHPDNYRIPRRLISFYYVIEELFGADRVFRRLTKGDEDEN